MSERVPCRCTASCSGGAPHARPAPPRRPRLQAGSRSRQGRPPPSCSPAASLTCGALAASSPLLLGATEPAGPAALPRGNHALCVTTRHAQADTHTHPHKGHEHFPAFPRSKRLLLGGWKRRCSPAVRLQPFHTVYGFKDRSCINPCSSPDKGRERGIAGPGLPGPRQIEDA